MSKEDSGLGEDAVTKIFFDSNATLNKMLPGAIGKHRLAQKTSDNGERLLAFACCTHAL